MKAAVTSCSCLYPISYIYMIIGWHKSIVSSDWSDTMLLLSFTILYIWSLGLTWMFPVSGAGVVEMKFLTTVNVTDVKIRGTATRGEKIDIDSYKFEGGVSFILYIIYWIWHFLHTFDAVFDLNNLQLLPFLTIFPLQSDSVGQSLCNWEVELKIKLFQETWLNYSRTDQIFQRASSVWQTSRDSSLIVLLDKLSR